MEKMAGISPKETFELPIGYVLDLVLSDPASNTAVNHRSKKAR